MRLSAQALRRCSGWRWPSASATAVVAVRLGSSPDGLDEGRQRQGLRRRRARSLRSRTTPRSRATRSPASTTSAWRRASPASPARSACSRSASAWRGCCAADDDVRSRAVRRPMGGLCNATLELAGVAGDPSSRVHRLDPRAKLVGLLGLTVVAVTTPLAAWPVWVACAAVLVRRRGRRARRPAHDLAARAAGAAARAVRGRVRAVRPQGEVVASLGPFDVTREGLEVWAAASRQGHDRHRLGRPARRHDRLPAGAARRSRRCACRAR